MHPFSTPENTRKLLSGFLMFSGGKRKGVLGKNRLSELQRLQLDHKNPLLVNLKKKNIL